MEAVELTSRNLAILVAACEPALHVGKEHGNKLLRHEMIPSYNHKELHQSISLAVIALSKGKGTVYGRGYG